jgi:Na+-translocating ferredoxin:NAD+ oxidoreductase RnfC subunit
MLGARLSSSRGAIAAYDLGKWYGGIRLPPEKEQSTSEAVREMPIPEQVVLPLAQHSGDPAQPVVDVGDRVLKGQLNLAMSATPDPRG